MDLSLALRDEYSPHGCMQGYTTRDRRSAHVRQADEAAEAVLVTRPGQTVNDPPNISSLNAVALNQLLTSTASSVNRSATKPPHTHTQSFLQYHRSLSRSVPEWSRDCSNISSVIDIPCVVLQSSFTSFGSTFTFLNWHCSLDTSTCCSGTDYFAPAGHTCSHGLQGIAFA